MLQKVLVGQFMVGNVQRSKAVTSCMVSEEAGCQDETTLPQSTSPLAAHGSVAILASLATQAKVVWVDISCFSVCLVIVIVIRAVSRG